MMRKCLLRSFFLSFFLSPFLAEAQDDGGSVINIVSAQKTEYRKDAVSGGDIIEFSGEVVVSVSRGDSVTTITAARVNFSRERDLLYAEGNVGLENTEGGETVQQLTAQSLLFNTATLEGVFDDGRLVQITASDTDSDKPSSLIVSAELFGRDRSKAMAFKNGTLTFCEDPNPHWKIKASRIWLLPGNEFAFANALLYVGRVPVFYFPFFYYPKDELIFNPVFGYHPRKGYYLQTTTYLMGRKPLNTGEDGENSPLSFMQNSTLMKQRREGLILRNLDEKETGMPVNTLKFMGDYYVQLGGMVGVEGSFKPPKYISSIDFGLSLGFSRVLFPVGNGYSIYVTRSPSGKTYMDKSAFMGISLPFRYKMDFAMTVNDPLNLTVKLPLYSDAYYDEDFMDRKESMDWIGFLMNGAEEDEESDNYMSSFEWTVNGSYSLPPIGIVQPYLSSFSLQFSSSLLFNTVDGSGNLPGEIKDLGRLPAKKSFLPSQITPIKLSMDISGTLFEYPAGTYSSGSAPAASADILIPLDLGGTRPADRAAQRENEEGDPARHPGPDGGAVQAEEDLLPAEPALPVITFSPDSVPAPGGITYKLSYSITPDFQTQLTYPSLKQAGDFDWNNIQSALVSFKSPVKLTSALGYRDDFVSMTNSFSFLPAVQGHPVLMEAKTAGESSMGYSDSYIRSVRENDYAARKLDMESANEVAVKPFVYNDIFSETSVFWNTNIKLLRTEFVGTAEEPEWDYLPPRWDDRSITAHTFNINLAAKEDGFSQSLLLSSYLPPQNDRYTAALTLGFPFNITLRAEGGVEQKGPAGSSWKIRPFQQGAGITFFDGKLSFSQSYSYNLDEMHHESLTLTFSAYGVSLGFNMSYTMGYTFDKTDGWKEKKKAFLPSYLSLKYTAPVKEFTFGNGKISLTPGLNTEIYYNMVKPTSSYFTFSPSISFKIDKALELTFSSTSRNDVIFRYFQDAAGFKGEIPGEKNVFVDLFNSFAFWDETKRKNSGFKIKSFNLKITHDLHDWTLASEFELEPRLIKTGSKPYYDFNPYFSISVVWKPLSSIKTTVADDYGVFRLNPAKKDN